MQVLALYPAIDAQPIRELLDRYAYASPRFRFEFADPSERPDLLEKFQISEEQLGRGLEAQASLAGSARPGQRHEPHAWLPNERAHGRDLVLAANQRGELRRQIRAWASNGGERREACSHSGSQELK